MSINNGGPAFPVSTMVEERTAGYGHQDGPATYQFGGMTLRDYFAAKAMQGVLATHPPASELGMFVQYAYRIADAMLAEREKENNDAHRCNGNAGE